MLDTVLQNVWRRSRARALERSRAIRGGNCGVITKLVCEAEEIIRTTESFDSSRRNRLQAITLQLEGKLSLLKEMDKDVVNWKLLKLK